MAGKRKYNCNDNYFEEIDSEGKAYWLGFLLADGCITKKGQVQLLLGRKDRERVEEFKKAIAAENPVEDRKDHVEISKIRVSSPKMISDLAKYGCVQRKTKILRFPENVKDEYLRHIMRGYFDGDGSVWVCQQGKYQKCGVSITSTTSFIESFLSHFIRLTGSREGIGSISPHTSKGISIVTFSSVESFNILRGFFYDGSEVFLERKKDVFENFPRTSVFLKRKEDNLEIEKMDGEISNERISRELGVSLYKAQIMSKRLKDSGRIKFLKIQNGKKYYAS